MWNGVGTPVAARPSEWPLGSSGGEHFACVRSLGGGGGAGRGAGVLLFCLGLI